MAASRRIVAAVAVGVVAAAGLVGAFAVRGGSDRSGGGGADDDVRTVQPGAPGEGARELSGEDLADIEAPRHTPVDTAFMQQMLVHHAQALGMTALVDDRTDSEDVPLLAERITISQEAEINLIEQWMAERDEAVTPTDHADHELMPGMATPEQLAELKAARGPAFDALFLNLMIAHHEGALVMVESLYASGGGLEPAVDHLAREIEADQTVEIARMTDMQSARGS